MSISNAITGWHVMTEASMSLKGCELINKPYRDPRKTNRELFSEHLKKSLGDLEMPQKIETIEHIEQSVASVRSCLMESFENSCPLRIGSTRGRATPWWSKELGRLRALGRKLFNKAKNSKSTADWEAYNEHRKVYKKLICKRQRDVWRSFCSGIESTTSAARLKKIISKNPNQQPGSLKRGDGTYTTTSD